LLDEILRGTNSRERLIATKAVLKELSGRNAAVLVTTHDLELAGVFKNSHVKFFHFEESVRDDKMYFDYKIREGIVQSSNALRILQMEGLNLDFEG